MSQLFFSVVADHGNGQHHLAALAGACGTRCGRHVVTPCSLYRQSSTGLEYPSNPFLKILSADLPYTTAKMTDNPSKGCSKSLLGLPCAIADANFPNHAPEGNFGQRL